MTKEKATRMFWEKKMTNEINGLINEMRKTENRKDKKEIIRLKKYENAWKQFHTSLPED